MLKVKRGDFILTDGDEVFWVAKVTANWWIEAYKFFPTKSPFYNLLTAKAVKKVLSKKELHSYLAVHKL